MRDEFEQLPHGIVMHKKSACDLATGRELAKAAMVTYHGGPLSVLLGVHAMSSCPDARTAEGSAHFNTYYHLEQTVFRRPARL